MMRRMTKEEIMHLSTLSRISLSDQEAEELNQEIDSILEYVGQVNDIAATVEKKVGPVFNVFREDEITNEPGSCTPELTEAFPDNDGPYLKVKKILNPDG